MIRITAILLVVAVLVAACAGEDANDTSSSPEPGGGPISIGGGGSDSLPRPPGTTASTGGKSVEMGIGTYCWRTACVDMIGPVTNGRLAVNKGSPIRVALPKGAGEPKAASVSASPASGQPMKLDSGEEAWPFPALGPSTTLAATASGGEVVFTADLAPGLYVVSVFVAFADGAVSYGTVLRVH